MSELTTPSLAESSSPPTAAPVNPRRPRGRPRGTRVRGMGIGPQNLNARQMKFRAHWIEHQDPGAAYVHAGYSHAAPHLAASRLMKTPWMLSAVAEHALQSVSSKRRLLAREDAALATLPEVPVHPMEEKAARLNWLGKVIAGEVEISTTRITRDGDHIEVPVTPTINERLSAARLIAEMKGELVHHHKVEGNVTQQVQFVQIANGRGPSRGEAKQVPVDFEVCPDCGEAIAFELRDTHIGKCPDASTPQDRGTDNNE